MRHPSAFPAFLLFCAVAVFGCDEPPSTSTSRWDGLTWDSAGVMVVQNHGVPIWRQSEGWVFTPSLRIGVSEGDTIYMFGRISDIAILSDGRIVVADALFHNLRFFSPQGRYLNRVGAGGAGPGEFAGDIQILVGPGDTILAVDQRNFRANRITPDGEWLGSFSIEANEEYATQSWDDDPTNGRIASLLRPQWRNADPEHPGVDLLVRRDLYGALLDTIARLPTQVGNVPSGDDRIGYLYRGEPHYDLCNGMTVTGHSDEYRMEWRGPRGGTERIVGIDRERPAFTEQDEQSFLSRFNAIMEEGGVDPGYVATVRSRFRFPSVYPAYRRFVCGPAGTLLVQQIQPFRDMSEPELGTVEIDGERPPGSDKWDVFDHHGRYLGVLLLPTNPQRNAFTRDSTGAWLMVGVDPGEFGEPYVALWRIEGITQEVDRL